MKANILKKIHLHNFVLYEDETLEFDKGLNCIVGDTGAGKSLIIKAIKFLCGQICGSTIIRSSCQKLSIKAEIYQKDILSTYERIYLLDQNKHQCFINDQLILSSQYKKMMLTLFEVTEQNTKARFFSSNDLLNLIDLYLEKDILHKYQTCYQEYIQVKLEFDQLNKETQEISLKGLGANQLITKIQPHLELLQSEIELESQKELAQKTYKKKEQLTKLLALVEEQSIESVLEKCLSVYSKLEHSEDNFEHIQKSYSHWKLFKENIFDEYHKLMELGDIDTIMSKLHKLGNLKLELGKTAPEILDYYQVLLIEQEKFLHLSENKKILLNKLEKKRNILFTVGTDLYNQRLNILPKVSEGIDAILHQLNMPKAKTQFSLQHRLDEQHIHSLGLDQVQLLAQINVGSEFLDINDYASGGEKSRFLLAQKMIQLRTNENNPILLFDEIDAGISGETAICVAQCLLECSKGFQLIVISHLPQIAIKAHKLYYVKKEMDAHLTVGHAFHIKDNSSKQIMDGLFPLV